MARIARLLCAAILMVLAGVVVVTTLAGSMFTSEPQLVADLTGYTPARVALIQKDLAGSPDVSRGDVTRRVRQLLGRAPLSASALAFEGLSALRAGDGALADKAFAASYRRDPRNEAARIWIAQRAIDGGDMALAIKLLDGLIAIGPERSQLYLEAMAQLASLPGGAVAVGTRLESQPWWAGQVVSRLNKTLLDLDLLLELNRRTLATQGEYMARVLKEAGPEIAFRYWLRLVPEAEAARFTWPYDGELRNKPAPTPFNWTLHSDLAEFMPGGGLDLTYLGRGRLALLEQTLLLGPGRYRLVAKLSGDARDNGGGFGWSVACVSDASELGRVIARPLTSKSKSYTFEFVVPATDCPDQRLLLGGEPGEFPIRAHAELQSVAIIPLAEMARQ